jgi:Protein of unknown function (DUF3429)
MVRKIAWASGIGGVVILAAITVALFSPESRIRIPAITALVTFSAIILSHLGGIENGLALREEAAGESMRAVALALSILPSAAAWAVLWMPTPEWQIGGSLALFVAVWIADLWLSRHGLIPAWFVDMRTAVTVIVAIILGLALYLL